ncbi:MAG: mechanosensitive ion channel family protein [Thermodesulfobacteriota bacterium]
MLDKLIDRNLDLVIYKNSLEEWIIALATAFLIFLVTRILKQILYRKLSKTASTTVTIWDDMAVELIARIRTSVLLLVAVYFGALKLELPDIVHMVINRTVILVLLLQIGIISSRAIRFWFDYYRKLKLETNAGAVTTLGTLSIASVIGLWVILFFVALDNLGVDITALVAGLGVGGIAVALALQNILGDLFASLSIVLDKPFVMGDFIIVDSYMGTVEHVGLKTTRLRSLSGEELIFSNTDLLKSRIRNYQQMYERRVVFSLGVVYQTSHRQLSEIPGMIREIIESRKTVRFDRAHFKEYGAYSLHFEVVYYVLDPDYNIYMDTQEAINLAIYRRFEDAGIEFAYPTRTLYMERVHQAQPSPAAESNQGKIEGP